MFNYIQLINALLFEPIAWLILIAFVFLCYQLKKNRKEKIYLLLYSLLFAGSLLCVYIYNIQSSRYSAIIIAPSLILVAAACIKFRYYKSSSKIYRFISISMIIYVISICIIKDFRYNKFNNYAFIISEELKHSNTKHDILFTHNTQLYEPFIPIPTQNHDIDSLFSNKTKLEEFFQQYRYYGKTIYLLGKTPIDKNWYKKLSIPLGTNCKFIKRVVKNNHGASYDLISYATQSQPPNSIKQLNINTSRLSSTHIINNNFEAIMPPLNTAHFIKKIGSLGHDYYLNNKILLPKDWCLSISEFAPQNSVKIGMTDIKPLEGVYSLQISVRDFPYNFVLTNFLTPGNYLISFLIFGEVGTEFSIGKIIMDPKQQHIKIMNVCITQGNVQRIVVPLFKNADEVQDKYNIYPCIIISNGTIIVDDFEIFKMSF